MPTASQLQGLFEPGSSAGTGYVKNGTAYPARIDPVFDGIGGGSWVWTGTTVSADVANAVNLYENVVVTFNYNQTLYPVRAFAVKQAPAASSPTGASPVEAVYTYWSLLQAGKTAQAFQQLTPANQQRVGGLDKFLAYYQSDPLLSAKVDLDTVSQTATQATVGVVQLQTQGGETGCRNWTGTYSLLYENSEWLIDRADLSYTAC